MPYCGIDFEDFTAANGKRDALQVFFRQTDQQAMHVSVMEVTAGAPTWVVFQNNNGSPISDIAVNLGARALALSSKSISNPGTGGAVTLAGTVAFPPNSTGAAGCGT